MAHLRVLLFSSLFVFGLGAGAQEGTEEPAKSDSAVQAPNDDLKASPTGDAPSSPAAPSGPVASPDNSATPAVPALRPPGVPSGATDEDDEDRPNWELTGGIKLGNFYYVESISGGASSETGIFPLVWLRAAVPKTVYGKDVIFHSDLTFAYQANTNYSGTTLNSDQSVQANDRNDFLDLTFTAEVPLLQSLSFDGGLGFHYWKRTITQGGGYDEYYTHDIVPLGLKYYFSRMDEDSNSGYEVSLTAHYDWMLNPQMRVVFSDSVISGDNSNFKLGARDGYDISVEVKGRYDDDWNWVVQPYIENFGYGTSGQVYNSTPVNRNNTQVPLGNILEPSSNTQNIGVKLGAIYKF